MKRINNEQINQKFDEDFYSQILSAKKFSNINQNLHFIKNIILKITLFPLSGVVNENLKEF